MADGAHRTRGDVDGDAGASSAFGVTNDVVVVAIAKMTDSVVASAIARRYAFRAGLDRRRAGEVAVVVSELATNIVKHGGGVGRIELSRSPEGVRVRSVDGGPDPAATLLPGRRGLGCGGGAVRRLMDEVQVSQRTEGGLEVCALKRA